MGCDGQRGCPKQGLEGTQGCRSSRGGCFIIEDPFASRSHNRVADGADTPTPFPCGAHIAPSTASYPPGAAGAARGGSYRAAPLRSAGRKREETPGQRATGQRPEPPSAHAPRGGTASHAAAPGGPQRPPPWAHGLLGHPGHGDSTETPEGTQTPCNEGVSPFWGSKQPEAQSSQGSRHLRLQ